MKMSSNTIGILVFIVLATALFVLMALRPAVERTSMNLGFPMTSNTASATTEPAPAVEEEITSEPAPEATESSDEKAESSESEATEDKSMDSNSAVEDENKESTTEEASSEATTN